MKHENIRMTLLALAVAVAVAGTARAHTETVDGIEWQYANESDGVVIGSGGNAPAIPSNTAGALAIPSRLGRRPVIGIGEYAFYMCESLTEVTIPEGVADIGDMSFYGCHGLAAVSIPGSVTRIGAAAFGECGLQELAIPDSVEEIGGGAFSSCELLSSVTLPSGLASIGAGTFSWCTSLTKLRIPDSVTSVGAGAFTGSGLLALSVPGSWIDTAILEGADVPAGCTVTYRGASGDPLAVATDALPPGTQWTFYSATLEASGGAEPYTWSLSAGSALPDGLWLSSDGSGDIGGVAQGTGEFTFTVVVTDAEDSIASKELTLLIEEGWTPDPEESETVAGVTWTYTVSGGRATVTGADPAEGALTVPSTLGGLPVAAIGEYAFEYRDGITGIVIPDSVEEIGNAAFSACEKLAKAVIGAGVTDIGTEAFTYCYALQAFEVAAANPAYAAADGVLFDKAKTTLVQCPGGKAGDYAIPDGVTAIGESAFSGCAKLTRLSIPASVADIAGGAWTFDGCNALEAFEVVAANPAYAGQDGVLFDKAMSTLIQYPCAKSGAYAIPDGVTDVGDHSFAWSENLTGLAMGNSVVRIGQQAFYGCVGLTDLALPEGLESIGYAALSYCTGLTQVAIPANVTLLPDELLFGCTALTDVRIPDGVTEIGGTAFYGCTALARVAMGSGVAVIGYGAFEDCTALETLAIPAATTEVGYGAFRNSGLKTLYVPASWEGTSMLDEAEVPEGCTIVYEEEEPADETTTTGVPHSWLDENAADILAANGGDHEAAAKAPAANGRPVWECYVAGLSTADADAVFKVKSISFADGEPVIEWDPDLAGDRTYIVQGKASMADEWSAPDTSSRFFRVKVVVGEETPEPPAPAHTGVQLWKDGPYWAETNLGAEEPEEYGLYFWWGDTVGYRREESAWVASDGSSENFSFGSGNTPTYGKSISTLQSEGWIVSQDGTYVLAPEHDAAQVQWGRGWRMPTYQELYDLCYNQCDWTWTTQNGVKGYVVRGRGDFAEASIFLPAAGGGGDGTSLYGAGSYGDYWSSVPHESNSNGAGNLSFGSGYHGMSDHSRRYGQSVRPVQGFAQ